MAAPADQRARTSRSCKAACKALKKSYLLYFAPSRLPRTNNYLATPLDRACNDNRSPFQEFSYFNYIKSPGIFRGQRSQCAVLSWRTRFRLCLRLWAFMSPAKLSILSRNPCHTLNRLLYTTSSVLVGLRMYPIMPSASGFA